LSTRFRVATKWGRQILKDSPLALLITRMVLALLLGGHMRQTFAIVGPPGFGGWVY